MRLASRMGAALLVAAIALGAPTFAQPMQQVTVAHTATLTGGLPRLAAELGLFEQHGLEARLVQMDSANATATALISGSVDAAMSGPGELIAAQARGTDMVMIANTYNGLNGTIVLSKAVAEDLGVSPDAPVAERLKAMDGLVLASTSSTSSFTVAARGAIEATGAAPRFVFMAQSAMQAAMESGSIQAYMASPPFWTVPVLNGTGVVWVSGPKGEFPKELSPASAVGLYMMRDTAESQPDIARQLAAVFGDLAKAFVERPAEVKAGILSAFPGVDQAMVDTFYDVELGGFAARSLTTEDMAHEIAFVKAAGANLPGLEKIDPARMLYP